MRAYGWPNICSNFAGPPPEAFVGVPLRAVAELAVCSLSPLRWPLRFSLLSASLTGSMAITEYEGWVGEREWIDWVQRTEEGSGRFVLMRRKERGERDMPDFYRPTETSLHCMPRLLHQLDCVWHTLTVGAVHSSQLPECDRPACACAHPCPLSRCILPPSEYGERERGNARGGNRSPNELHDSGVARHPRPRVVRMDELR